MQRAASPAESLSSTATVVTHGTKRKERDYESDNAGETNINVVVRCRGRNEREVRENSPVVVGADGVKGSAVNLSMGPNAISNKTYNFDRVFSPAADQSMIFDDVVKPILEDVSTNTPHATGELEPATYAYILSWRCFLALIAQFLPTARQELERHIPCLVI